MAFVSLGRTPVWIGARWLTGLLHPGVVPRPAQPSPPSMVLERPMPASRHARQPTTAWT